MCESLLTVVSLQQVGEGERRGGKVQDASSKWQVAQWHDATRNKILKTSTPPLFALHASRDTLHALQAVTN